MKLFRVLWQVDAYICEDWFASEYIANRCADQREGKERLIDSFQVDRDFCKRNSIDLSDSEYYSEYEWEQIEAWEAEHGELDL